ncbi:MAG: hypothetical protein Q8P34_03170 [Bacteroidota bacterium]|nr:hypothetical protein [Bacteroidota bacterium]
MKVLVITVLFGVLTLVGFSQKKIKKLDIKEEGFSVNIKYQPILDKIESKGITVIITPLAANELNVLFSQSNQLDGKFDYSYFEASRDSYFLKNQKKKREKSDSEFLLEGIEWLVDNEKINQLEYIELRQQVLTDFIPDYKNELSDAENITFSNPYFLGNTYLNMFKIDLINSTSSVIKFDENILIKNGNNVSTKLSSDFVNAKLVETNTLNLNKSLTLKRYNLDMPILIPPNTTVTKYFSVLPIELSSDKLEIIIPNYSQSLSWKVIKNQDKINKQYSYYEFALSSVFQGQVLYGLNYIFLGSNSAPTAYVGDSKIFISSDDTEKKIEAFILTLYGDQLYFARKSDIRAMDYLDVTKNKRFIVTLDTEKLTEVKRKGK